MDIRENIVLPKPLKVYPKVTKRNVQALFNDCMKVKDSRVAWLIETAVQLGAERNSLDFSPDSLVHIWEVLMPYVVSISPPPVTLEQIASCPEWFGVHYDYMYSDNSGLDLLTIWLLDGLMYYYGEVQIRNIKGLEWQIGNLTPKWADFGMAQVLYKGDNMEYAAFWNSPFRASYNLVSSVASKNFCLDKNLFFDAYVGILKLIASGHYRKRPAELEPNIAAPLPEAFEFGIEQNDDDADYPYHVWFFEGTEYELGIKTFNSLRKRFAAIDGIKKVIHEDREVFLIKSDLAIETLKERIWATFCQVCAEVVANKQAQAEARAAKRAAAKAVKIV